MRDYDWKSQRPAPQADSAASATDPRMRAAMHRRMLQRKAKGQAAPNAEGAVEKAAQSGGERLPAALQKKFESHLGADLSGVRVHSGGESAAASEAVGARAYTTGNNIHFNAGEYAPSSRAGQELLAHEVVHTVQQSRGGADLQRKLATDEQQSDADEQAADSEAAKLAGGEDGKAGGEEAKTQGDEKPKQEHADKHGSAVERDLVKEVELLSIEIEAEARNLAAGTDHHYLAEKLRYLRTIVRQIDRHHRKSIAKHIDRVSASVALVKDEDIFVGLDRDIREEAGLSAEYHGEALPEEHQGAKASLKKGIAATLDVVRDQAREVTHAYKSDRSGKSAAGGVEHVVEDLEHLRRLFAQTERESPDRLAEIIAATQDKASEALNEVRKVQQHGGADPLLASKAAHLRQRYGIGDDSDRQIADEERVSNVQEERKEREQAPPKTAEISMDPATGNSEVEFPPAKEDHTFDKIEASEPQDPKTMVKQAIDTVGAAIVGAFVAAQRKLTTWEGAAEISDDEKKNPPGFNGSLLGDLAFTALMAGTGELLGEVIAGVAIEEAEHHPALKEGLKGFVSGIFQGAAGMAKSNLTTQKQDQGAGKYARIEFFDQQAKALDSQATQQVVNLQSNVGVDALESRDPLQTVEDLRATYIQITQNTEQAAQKQFDTTLSKWCSYLAQEQMKQQGGGDTDLKDVSALDKRFYDKSTRDDDVWQAADDASAGKEMIDNDLPRGVLTVELHWNGDQFVPNTGRVQGLNQYLRDQLGERRLDEIGVPMVFTSLLDTGGKLVISVTESGAVSAEYDEAGKGVLQAFVTKHHLASEQEAAEYVFRNQLGWMVPSRYFEIAG